MGTVCEEFLLKFNNLEGVTVAERRKNFFKLLHQIAPLLKDNPEDLDLVSTNLKANSFLEDLFKVDFFIYFRRTSELLQILKDGNSVFVSKVAKQSWFFQQAFNDVPAERFVNEILPCMSYSVRMKVLRKLSRYASCENFEKIYDALVARYGIYLASQFITGCGPDKVRQILIECPNIRLTSTQLRILYDKDLELVDFYFIHSKYSIQDHQYSSLIKFIYHKNRSYFDYLKLKYEISIKLGRRASKKFVADNKDAVIENPSDFDYLNMKAVTRKIGKDSVRLYINTLCRFFETERTLRKYDFSNRYNYFAKKYHYSLFFKTYQSHYKIKFEDYPELINEYLLKMIPDGSERANLAKVKVNEGCDEYIKYLLIDESVALIKEKINFTSDIDDRRKLIRYLVETCHINNDLNALFSVLKYFCVRHKNDDLSVHTSFIRNVENLFGFKNFTEEMWSCMNELLMIQTLKFDKSDATYEKIQTRPLLSCNLGLSSYQTFSYLEFLFKKGEPIDELIGEYFTNESNPEYPRYGKHDKSFERHFLLFTINNLSKQSDKQEDLSFNVNLISEIDKWNKCYKDDQLSFDDFPNLMFTFNHVIRDSEFYHQENMHKYPSCVLRAFRSKIFTTEQNSCRNEYLQVYWERSDKFLSLDDIKWFLKYDPVVIVEHFETVFQKLVENDTIIPKKTKRFKYRYIMKRFRTISNKETKRFSYWYIIKKFRHLQLDQKSVVKCLEKLNEDDPKVVKTKYIRCLSVLMKPNDYASLANSYKPENKALSLTNQKEVKLYDLHCAIATEFKNTKSYELLPSLLNYCAGDYFKQAMPSLYSLLYRTPENMLPQYLKFLSNKAVSVRKHALYMICELNSLTDIQNELQRLNEREKVSSLQKHMFETTIQYFVKNPTDSFFELVKSSMVFITKNDDESLSCIVNQLLEIPQKYKASYVLHAWEHLEKTVDIWSTLASLKSSLLSSLGEKTVKEFPLDWGLRIIHQHFMTENDRDLNGIQAFMFKFLSCKDEKSVIFEKIFALLDQCEDQVRVLDFLSEWNSKIMRSDRTDLKHLYPFVDYFEKKITPVENFNHYVRTFFLKIRIDHPRPLAIDEFSLKVLTVFEQVNGNYGPRITHLFAKEMDANLSYFLNFLEGKPTTEGKPNTCSIVEYLSYSGKKKFVRKLDIYHSMITQRPVPPVAILLLHVVTEPSSSFACLDVGDERKTFKKILERIKRIDDAGVQINLQCKFSKALIMF